MTPQEIFDKSVRGIIEQGGPSVDERSACVYRGPGEKKCAIGHVIDDGDYCEELEGKNCGELFEFWGHDHPLYEHNHLLHELQSAHDQAAVDHVLDSDEVFMVDFLARARRIAEINKLDPIVIEEAA